MDGICYIIGASDAQDIYINMNQSYYVIAADGGYAYLEEQGIAVDLIVGDFDSLGKVPDHEHIIRHQPEKDDTDLLLAVKEGFAKGYKTFVIYGALGGRLDHTYGNIQILTYIAERGGIGYLLQDETVVTAIMNDTISFDESYTGIVSVFSAGNCAHGVYLKGLKYELTDAVLTCSVPLGVSNEFIGIPSAVSVENGSLIIMWSHNMQETVRQLPKVHFLN